MHDLYHIKIKNKDSLIISMNQNGILIYFIIFEIYLFRK